MCIRDSFRKVFGRDRSPPVLLPFAPFPVLLGQHHQMPAVLPGVQDDGTLQSPSGSVHVHAAVLPARSMVADGQPHTEKLHGAAAHVTVQILLHLPAEPPVAQVGICLLYTSDAADDLLCVDIGGRRIIKKKIQKKKKKKEETVAGE